MPRQLPARLRWRGGVRELHGHADHFAWGAGPGPARGGRLADRPAAIPARLLDPLPGVAVVLRQLPFWPFGRLADAKPGAFSGAGGDRRAAGGRASGGTSRFGGGVGVGKRRSSDDAGRRSGGGQLWSSGTQGARAGGHASAAFVERQDGVDAGEFFPAVFHDVPVLALRVLPGHGFASLLAHSPSGLGLSHRAGYGALGRGEDPQKRCQSIEGRHGGSRAVLLWRCQRRSCRMRPCEPERAVVRGVDRVFRVRASLGFAFAQPLLDAYDSVLGGRSQVGEAGHRAASGRGSPWGRRCRLASLEGTLRRHRRRR
mmetsp:Transcript_29177/g.88292  ORF Transcript_29177/g.88292 Transcript_29177/m.88292 type:complete len:314 (+) Transcript_29177:382-1323(+)